MSQIDHLKEASRMLKSHPLNGVDAKALAPVLERATIQRMGDREVLCTEGDAGDAMYFLFSGRIQVMRRDSQGQMRELATMRAPALLGHMALVDNSPRSASCICDGPAVIGSLGRREYNTLLADKTWAGTALRRLVLSSLMRQLTSGNQRVRELIFEPGDRLPSDAPPPKRRKADLIGDPASRAGKSGSGSPRDADISTEELLQVAGMLEGWKVDDEDLDSVEIIFDEQQQRSGKNPKR